LVGEIRDEDTAEMAFRAAMTGHQVFSTLHTNSALGAVPRLLDIGVMPDVMAGNIIGILAQRLVRKLCDHCKESYTPSELEIKIMDLEPTTTVQLHRAVGCEKCEGRGFKGRTALMEVLRIDSDLDEAIAHKATKRELNDLAVKNGFSSLAEDGIRQICNGITSIDEVSRVVDLTDRVKQ